MNINFKNQVNDIGWNFNNSYIHLPKKLYTNQELNPVISPQLIILNESLAGDLGLDIEGLQRKDGLDILSGNKVPKGGHPIAQAYAGHQFGYFTMLGDGRAILLGEHITPKGERYDIQLKGSGRTPYSRGGDGRAALGPMLREYIISEAMHGLGIPTTRSLAVVTTGENIFRETELPGAILTRVSSSHIRVGTFQYVSAYGSREDLQLLAEYTLQRHFPDMASDENRFILLLREAIRRQAELIAKWQLVGFIHGVMNTDNMVISGESIDFGPCAFMDVYNTETVFSSIDRHGRYAYGKQPEIAAWNLARFAETLLPLLDDDEEEALRIANKEVTDFLGIYRSLWNKGMKYKLGIFNEEPGDNHIIGELLDLMQRYNADFTNTFRGLTLNQLNGMKLFHTDEFIKWKEKWEVRISRQKESLEELRDLMKKYNPSIIPRNYLVEKVLEAAVKNEDYSMISKLLHVLRNPYEYSKEQEEYSILPPKSTSPYKTFCGT